MSRSDLVSRNSVCLVGPWTGLVAAVLLAVVAVGASAVEAADQAPGFRLPDLNGRMQQLESYRGRVVVLNFWATWCKPCNTEMPELVQIQNRYAPYGVQVVAAAADPVSSKANVIEFVERLGLNFPILLSLDEETMAAFGFSGALPATAVIDPEGRVVARYDGRMVERHELSSRIEALLGETAVHTPRKRKATVAW